MNEVYNCDCLDFLQSNKYKSLDKSRVVVVTDPPFNIGYHYGFYKDRMDEGSYFSMLGQIVESAPYSVIIHYPEALHHLSMVIGRVPEKVVSWVYNSNTAKQHRDIAFYGIKPDMNKVRQPYKNPNDKRIRERIAKGIGGGETLRLVEHQPSQECVQEDTQPSLCHALGSHGENRWHPTKRCHHLRPLLRFRHYKDCLPRERVGFCWMRDRQGLLGYSGEKVQRIQKGGEGE